MGCLVRKSQIFFLVCLVTLLSSCGFHPRGAVTLAPPLYNLYLKTPSTYGQLAVTLKNYLTLSGVNFANSPIEATTILEILQETTSQQMLSVSGTQLTRQYNLILTVSFQITTPQNVTLVAPQVITETRVITVQADQILGGSNEANNLYQQMRQAIAYDMMNRLSSRQITSMLVAEKT